MRILLELRVVDTTPMHSARSAVCVHTILLVLDLVELDRVPGRALALAVRGNTVRGIELRAG